jgi:hypothetical protein
MFKEWASGILIGTCFCIDKNVLSNKRLIKEYVKCLLREEWWLETYDKDLLDDPAFNEQSVFVPDDIKSQIKDYLIKMGLSTKREKKTKS